MSVKYGFNMGTSDMKTLLEQNDRQLNGVRSWKQIFGGASQQYAQQNSAIVSSYSDAIAQAYASNLAQQDAIAGAGLNVGATREMIESNRAALHSAYQTYVQNYGNAVSANAQNYSATVKAYDDELTARAENFSKLYNYAYQYLAEELAGSTYNGNAGGAIANGTNWLTANKLDWLYDAKSGKAKSWDSISGELFDRDTREITDKGREFFDAMFNAQTGDYITSKGEGTRGFDKWLSDTDAELRDWYVQGDIYNSTEMGTNSGTAKQLLGLESTDQSYAHHEYLRSSDIVTNDYNISELIQYADAEIPKLHSTYDAYLSAKETYETLLTRAEQANSVSPGSGNMLYYEAQRYKSEYDRMKTAWEDADSNAKDIAQKYKKEFNESWNKTISTLKNTLGTEKFDSFKSEYADIFDLYDQIDSHMLVYMTPETVQRYQELITSLNKAMSDYITAAEKSRS